MKHLITSGCSFSDYENPERTWPLHLQDLTQDKYNKFHHLGACAQGQDYISRSVIYQVNELLHKHDAKDIFVVVCWSGLQRRALLVNKETTKMHYRFNDWNPGDSEEMRECKIGSWQDFDEEYQKIQCEEHNIIQSMEHIIRTQDFLKVRNVDFKFFGFNNLFANLNEHNFLTKSRGVRIDKKYPNTSYLFNIMDWDKWWFHKKFGGLGDWVNDNIKDGFDGGNGNSGHPLSDSQKLFTKEVVLKWIK